MINQWENVGRLKCPIPTIPPIEFNSTETTDFISFLETTTAGLINQSFIVGSDHLEKHYMRSRPLYCVEDGAEILDDLKIRPVKRTFNFNQNHSNLVITKAWKQKRGNYFKRKRIFSINYI